MTEYVFTLWSQISLPDAYVFLFDFLYVGKRTINILHEHGLLKLNSVLDKVLSYI